MFGNDVLHTVITQILLPPINVLMFGVICGCLPDRLARLRRWGSFGCIATLLLLSLPVTSNLLLQGLEYNTGSDTSPTPPQAIVILGGDNVTGMAIGGIVTGVRVGGLSLERVRAAALLQKRSHLPVLITGASLSANHPPVAKLMADMMQNELSVPVRWIETEASDTWQNAARSAAILQRERISSVFVVTQPWHMRRAVMAFRHFGITVVPAATALDVLSPRAAADFIPHPAAWVDSYFAFHEWIGCAYYALRS